MIRTTSIVSDPSGTGSVPRGLWNVPYITQVYLIKGSVLRSKLSQVSLFVDEGSDPDMVFCRSIRDQVSPPVL